MPLPLFFIAAAAATAVVGTGKTIKAGVDNSNAKKLNESANSRIEIAKNRLDTARRQSSKMIDKLGSEKLFVLDNSVSKFLVSFEKIKNIDFTGSEGLNELGKINIDENTFEDLHEMTSFASSLLSGSVTGVASGAVAAFGAYSAATTLATASTGTAIASLSGAAATNATLAFFGGGSLAAGGLGIAGGTAVLGGLVAGPALMVMGFVTGAKASKNLEESYANEAKSKQIAEELETATDLCKNISRRTMMFYNLLVRLDSYFIPLVYKLGKIVEEEGIDYSKYSTESKSIVCATASIAQTIKAVLDTAILNEDGSLTIESKDVSEKLYKEINYKSSN